MAWKQKSQGQEARVGDNRTGQDKLADWLQGLQSEVRRSEEQESAVHHRAGWSQAWASKYFTGVITMNADECT